MKNKIYILTLLFICISFGSTGFTYAQEKSSAAGTTDVIIRTDGLILYGKVLEIDANIVKYRKGETVDGAVISIPRSLVYAVSYADKTTQIITPVLGSKKTENTAFDQSQVTESKQNDSMAIKPDFGRGMMKLGTGIENSYANVGGVNSYDKISAYPTIFLSYAVKVNKLFDAGVSLTFARGDYQKKTFSDYDQLDVTQEYNQKIFTLGLFGKYNLTRSNFNPYVLAGVDFNYTNIMQNSDFFFTDQDKHVKTELQINGVITKVIARVGIDINITKRFGFFADAGLGVSLVTAGVNFIFQ
jgi:hypothetical protein